MIVDRAARARIVLRVWAMSIAAAIGAIVVIRYGVDVHQRLHAGNCLRETSAKEVGEYVAEICLPPARGMALLRLYSKPSGTLLAERLYEHSDPHLIWTREELIYDTGASDGKGTVGLPPTWWDRLLAFVP